MGESWSMALLLNRVARHCTPAGPMCLSRCSGIALKPVLFSALKCFSSTAVISAGVMWWRVGFVRGANRSGLMEAS